MFRFSDITIFFPSSVFLLFFTPDPGSCSKIYYIFQWRVLTIALLHGLIVKHQISAFLGMSNLNLFVQFLSRAQKIRI